MNAQSGNSWQIVFALQEACDPLFDEFMENFFAASACDYTDDGKVRYIGYSSAPVDEPADGRRPPRLSASPCRPGGANSSPPQTG